MSKRIITDNIDLSNKDGFSKDEFYGKNKVNVVSNDSATSSKGYSGDKRFFALLSTSDKEINNRLYDYESWKKTVTDGMWQGKPYAKPLLRNHSLEWSSSDGRIIDSFFIDHSTLEVTNKDGGKLPQDVIDFYKNNDGYATGTGSIIVEINCSADTAERIESGLDLTVSQSSFMDSATCNICGKDYYSGCDHFAGRTYDVQDGDTSKTVKCLVKTKDYSPIELSIVNLPANDSSVIYASDKKKKKKCDSTDDNIENKINDNVGKFDDNQSTVQNVQDNSENKTSEGKPLTKSEDAMWKNLAKDHFAGKLKIKFDGNEKLIKAFEDLFETVSEEQTQLFKDFIEEVTSVEANVEEEPEVVNAKTEDTKIEPEVKATEEPTIEVKEEPVIEDSKIEPEVPVEEKAEDIKSKALEEVFTKDVKVVKNKFEDKTLEALVANVKF